MIRAIAAIDSHSGIANEHGIPWKLPTDVQYFREMTLHQTIIMGYHMYQELAKPLPERTNMVVTHDDLPLRAGFLPIRDITAFLEAHHQEDYWIVGGAGLYQQTLKITDELYLTRIDKDFHCTRFFPPFETDFTLRKKSDDAVENDIHYHFEVWQYLQTA